MAEDTFLEQWDAWVLAIPQLENLHEPGIGRSYPLPAVEDGRVVLRHFYHVATQTGMNSLYLGQPMMCATLDLETKELVETFPASELDVEPFEDTTYRLTNEQKAAIRPRIDRVKQLYDVIIEKFPYEPGGDAGQEFWAAFEKSVPPPLLPYYRALSPDFVAWCMG